MIPETTTLMTIGKLELTTEEWDWGVTLQLVHEEVQQDPFYSNEEVETEISVEQAEELIEHLQNFINKDKYANQ